MKILITGSAGHLGEALIRTLRSAGEQVVGIDIKPSAFTDFTGSISDRAFVSQVMADSEAVIHTATLHKPHVGTHSRQAFIDTNISGTLNLLEEAVLQSCKTFIYTSTTSTFGDSMKPAENGQTVWVTEQLACTPKNIYGATKTAAEDLCALFHRNTDLSCVVLKTSRFFPEEDDMKKQRDLYSDENLKVNELLFRRADIADIVSAHQLAIEKAQQIGFQKLIVSATTPFTRGDVEQLSSNVSEILQKYVPQYVEEYQQRNWTMIKALDRVYDNQKARELLGWEPVYSFAKAISLLASGQDFRSELTKLVGSKGYHSEVFKDGPYPVNGF